MGWDRYMRKTEWSVRKIIDSFCGEEEKIQKYFFYIKTAGVITPSHFSIKECMQKHLDNILQYKVAGRAFDSYIKYVEEKYKKGTGFTQRCEELYKENVQALERVKQAVDKERKLLDDCIELYVTVYHALEEWEEQQLLINAEKAYQETVKNK